MKTGVARWVQGLVALLIVAAAVGYLFQGMKPEATVAMVKRQVAVLSVPATVRVVAEVEMDLRSELPGRVLESRLELGRSVSEGDVLVAMDTGDVDIAIERVRIQLDAARRDQEKGSNRRFSLPVLEEQLEDARRRLAGGSASQTEVEARERDIRDLERAIEGDENALDLRVAQLENELKGLERDREKLSIRAPIDGIVTAVGAYRGDLAQAGQTVARIISLDRRVEAQVSEENFSGVAEGQLVRVKFLGYGAATFDGKVSKTLPVADPETQRYTVHVDLDIPQERLFPGLSGEATITLSERPDALVVPGTALMGDRVFVVEEGRVSLRRVQRGYGSLTSVEVVSGLSEGEQVIVEELELFKDGDRVRAATR